LANPCLTYNNSAFETINIGTFGGGVVYTIANAKNMWAEQNLIVNVLSVTGSYPQFRDLKSGVYDLVSSAIDNTINYRFNDESPRNIIPGKFDCQQILASDRGSVPASLYVHASITTYAQFNGKRLGVDSPDTAFALVAYKLLRIHGLERDINFTVISFGGTLQRFQALTGTGPYSTPQCEGTILGTDFVFRADDFGTGLHPLGTILDLTTIAGGGGVTGREIWLKENKNVVSRFLKAYHKAQNYILDPANKVEILSILKVLSGNYSEKIYNATVNPVTGLISDLNPQPQAINFTVELRREFSGFEKTYPVVFGFDTVSCMSTPGGSVYSGAYLSQAFSEMVPPLTYTPPVQVVGTWAQAFCLTFDLYAVEVEPIQNAASSLAASWLVLLMTLMALVYVRN